MKVDYHVHTLCSDGVFTVEEVINMAISESIEQIAITDHDTLDSIIELKRINKEINFINGIEITCQERKFNGSINPLSIHLLGYNICEDNNYFKMLLDERRKKVKLCFESLCSELRQSGMSIFYNEIPISCGNVMQLSDIYNYLSKIYKSPSDLEVLRNLISNYETKLTMVNITVEDGIKAIHDAGGIAVWAHPFNIYRRFKKHELTNEEVINIMDELKYAGIDGIEADYLGFIESRRQWLREEAKSRELITTGGSDFHGSSRRGKMGIEISKIPFVNNITCSKRK